MINIASMNYMFISIGLYFNLLLIIDIYKVYVKFNDREKITVE